ncbi:hypothetical protein ACTXKB_03735 [Psychrobacter aquimaris]|uniref:hypothetical protein n=1 Tax=Psychrobacter aquimaris TaxID=292733 RepID=UPI003FD3A2F7
MKYLLLIIFMFCSSCFAKEMDREATYYNFSKKALNSLGSSVATCDSYALQDPETEWLCGSYGEDQTRFIVDWESSVKSFEHQLIPYSDWFVSRDDDGAIDFYGKAYYFNEIKILVAFDPSETRREVFIGVSPNIFLLADAADSYLKKKPNIPKMTLAETTLSDSYSCKDFDSQVEAMQFFEKHGFNVDYDPYNLDADNDGIPCEVFQNQGSYTNQCTASESWVNGYVRKNGTRVRGHCRKKR